MNQRERSFLYRGTFLLILAGVILSWLAKFHEPWVRHVGDIGSVFVFLAMAAFILFVVVKQQRQLLNAPISNEPLPPSLESPPSEALGSNSRFGQRPYVYHVCCHINVCRATEKLSGLALAA